MSKIEISEEELHAYLDGELPQDRRDDLDIYLRAHPDEARRLDGYRKDGEAIARLFARPPGLIEAVQPASQTATLFTPDLGTVVPKTVTPPVPSRSPVWQNPVWRNLAAGLIIFAVGSVTGWFGRDRSAYESMTRLGYQAETAYLLMAKSGIEVGPSTIPELSNTVTQALGVRMTFHDTSATGLSLGSARIVNGAVQFAFNGPDGVVVTMYFEKRPGATETSFHRISTGRLTTLVWEDDGLACAITGPMSPAALEDVARRLYKSLMS